MKNLIIEMVENKEIKENLYNALESGKSIVYTTNLRATPNCEYNSDSLKIAVEPTQKMQEYFDKTIKSLSELIGNKKDSYKKGMEKMNSEKREKAVSTLVVNNLRVNTQYETKDIIDYILS